MVRQVNRADDDGVKSSVDAFAEPQASVEDMPLMLHKCYVRAPHGTELVCLVRCMGLGQQATEYF